MLALFRTLNRLWAHILPVLWVSACTVDTMHWPSLELTGRLLTAGNSNTCNVNLNSGFICTSHRLLQRSETIFICFLGVLSLSMWDAGHSAIGRLKDHVFDWRQEFFLKVYVLTTIFPKMMSLQVFILEGNESYCFSLDSRKPSWNVTKPWKPVQGSWEGDLGSVFNLLIQCHYSFGLRRKLIFFP